MDALIILAHGSRRDESNAEVEKLTKKVSALADNRHDVVAHAFLELASPTFPDTVNELVKRGAKRITTLPYFLNSGNHVSQDIPTLLTDVSKRYPNCEFKVVKPIGMYEGMAELILRSTQNPST